MPEIAPQEGYSPTTCPGTLKASFLERVDIDPVAPAQNMRSSTLVRE